MGLTLTLRELQELLVGNDVKILILKVHTKAGKVRVTIDAPRSMKVVVKKPEVKGDDDDEPTCRGGRRARRP